jgi:transcriptional regulator with XRE-family HTH domain
MKPVWMYLDEAQERGLAANDSDIAAKLGVTKAAVCEWRKGRSAPAEDAAARLAELIGKPEVMAECATARAKTPEGRRMWERLARIAAAAMVLFGLMPQQNAEASIHAHVNTRCAYPNLLFSEAMDLVATDHRRSATA